MQIWKIASGKLCIIIDMVGNTNNLYFLVDNYMIVNYNFTPPRNANQGLQFL